MAARGGFTRAGAVMDEDLAVARFATIVAPNADRAGVSCEARARRRLGAAAAQQGLVNLPVGPAPLENDKLVDFFAMDAPAPRHPSPLGDAGAGTGTGVDAAAAADDRDAPTLILSSAAGRREDAR